MSGAPAGGAAGLVGLVFDVFFTFGGLGEAACQTVSGTIVGVFVRVPSICLSHGTNFF